MVKMMFMMALMVMMMVYVGDEYDDDDEDDGNVDMNLILFRAHKEELVATLAPCCLHMSRLKNENVLSLCDHQL